MKRIRFSLDPQRGTLSENDTKKYFSTVGFAVFAFIFVSYAASFAASLLVSRFFPSLLQSSIFKNALSLVVQYGIGLPACVLILCKLPKDTNPSEKLGIGKWIGGLCVAFTFMSVGNTVAQLIISLFEMGLGKTVLNPIESSAGAAPFWENVIFYVVLAPIIEELVFRKLICDRLLPLGEGYAVFLSATVFALVHGNFYQFFYALLTGMLFSAIYVKTGRIRYTVIYHMIINFFGAAVVPWAVGVLEPVFTEEMLIRLTEAVQSSDPALIDALSAELTPYMLPVAVFAVYELLFSVLSVAGVFVLFRYMRKLRFREGLLPPDKESRVANIFCNAGVATAIAGFAVIFILSLL